MKNLNLIIRVICVTALSCRKQRGTGCITTNTTMAITNDQIITSNYGDELPSQYVSSSSSLEWGAGTITSGQTGTHAYVTTGTYNIRLILNGDYAPDVTDVDESKVKIQITIN